MIVSDKIPLIRYCQVIDINDPTGGDRIKVFLLPEDNDKIKDDGSFDLDNIDFCIPLMPVMFRVKPKIGEGCLVLTAISNDGNSQRFYMGPVISQPNHMDFDPFFMGGDSQFRGAWKKPDVNPTIGEEAEGAFPENDDISIIGRGNSDIQVKENDIRLRSGVKLKKNEDNEIIFNSKNPTYIKLKYDEDKPESQGNVSIVSDKIQLLSHNSKKHIDGLNDSNDLISDETLNNLYKTAQRLPYGDELVEFLKIFKNAFIKHTHNFNGLPPNPATTSELTREANRLLENEELLSENIRIN